MRVVVTGATGNVGTGLVARLTATDAVSEVVGLARRLPRPLPQLDRVRWQRADVTTTDLEPIFDGADVVVHLAWVIQPIRDQAYLHRVNVHGTKRVLDAVGAAGVPAMVYASSVGAYSAGPKHQSVEESWPTGGVPTSLYSRQKAEVEELVDRFEAHHPGTRVVRLRKGLVFSAGAASEIARYFLGPFVPLRLIGRRRLPLVPNTRRLVFQAVHTDDAATAYVAAVTGDASGAFNIASDPPLDGPLLAEVLRARSVPLPAGPLRAATALSHFLRLQPTSPGWLDLALAAPVLDTTAARVRLGWAPQRSGPEALAELVDGFAEKAGMATPPLRPARGGRLRPLEPVGAPQPG